MCENPFLHGTGFSVSLKHHLVENKSLPFSDIINLDTKREKCVWNTFIQRAKPLMKRLSIFFRLPHTCVFHLPVSFFLCVAPRRHFLYTMDFILKGNKYFMSLKNSLSIICDVIIGLYAAIYFRPFLYSGFCCG